MDLQKISTVLLFISFVIFFSCGEDPLDKRYDKMTKRADLKKLKEDGEITNEQYVVLGIYFAHASYNNINLTGKTYRDLIKSAYTLKEQQKNEKPLISDAEKEKLDNLKRLLNIVTIELLKKEKSRSPLGKAVLLTFRWNNQGEMDITGIKGTVEFIDIYGKAFSELKVDYKELIFLSSTKEWTVQKSLFKESDYLFSKSIEYIRINWIPEKITFSDKQVVELNPSK